MYIQKISRHFCLLFLLISVQNAWAGTIYQHFEPDQSVAPTIWPVGNAEVSLADRTQTAHLGRQSVRAFSYYNWTGVGVAPRTGQAFNLKQINNDRLTFWTYALPKRNCYIYGCENGTDNNVGVTFYDTGAYASTGFEVWTTQTAHYASWTKLKVLFSQLPPNFDLTQVTKIEFKNYNPGEYYFDDIHAVREDRVYQSFEIQDRRGSAESEYGWKWNDADTASISVEGDPVQEGSHSWKMVLAGNWAGTGIQSQEQKYFYQNGQAGQTFWQVDLNPQTNDRLTFWIYGLPSNQMDNNLGVQFYDNGAHNSDDTKVVVWPKRAAVNGQWTRLSIMFSDILKQAPQFNLTNINKIQFQQYWPGTFYIDDIRATGPIPALDIDPAQAIASWGAVAGAQNYRLQESIDGENGPWKTIYCGSATSFPIKRISKHWLRVRWEEGFSDSFSLPYASPWSDAVQFLSPAVVFNFKTLQTGYLTWSTLAPNVIYQIQTAAGKDGPWQEMYKGPVAVNPLPAVIGNYYRIRAIKEINGSSTDWTPWSRPQAYTPGKGYIRAVDTTIKDKDGTGDVLLLHGINLGGGLVIEPWMTGLGFGDSPSLPDDWSIRQVLASRFKNAQVNALLKTFQDAYVNSIDFDSILDQGMTVVRLPFYYRNLQSDTGRWILNNQGQIDFSAMDRIVDAFADRGIYVILDLHGAPGLQSADANTGRKGFNQLFAPDGDIYRARTEDMWKEIARHYKDNPWVMGYDLLNEPVGAAPNATQLADVYDRLYQAIRAIDPHHLIMMEGIWYQDPLEPSRFLVDWDTLPNPQSRNWTNVMYQFHFYHWDYVDENGNRVKADEHEPSHKAFIDEKVARAKVMQPMYNVPVLIGEFYGFGLKSVWQYYIRNFNDQGWSWTIWSYKYHDSPSNWGVVNHTAYDESLPNFGVDSYNDLSRKLSKYTTRGYHTSNVTLQKVLAAEFPPSDNEPIPPSPSVPHQGMVIENGMFSYHGHDLGDTPSTFAFYPVPCTSNPTVFEPCNQGDAAITYWSSRLIQGYVPPDAADVSGRFNYGAIDGGELYPTMRHTNAVPVLQGIGNKTAIAGALLSFNVSASDADNDPLDYTAMNLPPGAVFTGQSFSWIPSAGQTGSFVLTFNVSDGQAIDQETITITVVNPLPDLTITQVYPLSQEVFKGNDLNVRTTVANSASVLAGGFNVAYRLSADRIYGNGNDISFSKTSTVSFLNGGQNVDVQAALRIGSAVKRGMYYVCARADSGNKVREQSEINNTACSFNPITVK